MAKTSNPFIIKGYYSKEYFCDRKNELQILIRNFENGINTSIISARKMGKSALIFRFFEEIKTISSVEFIYVDIYQSRTLNDFINLLAEAILKKFPEKSRTGARFMKFLKAIRPLISYDPVNGTPQVQITFQSEEEKKHSIFALFDFLENQEKKTVLVIDEFQQISFYPEKNTESVLRTYLQHLKNICFIFCGSNQHMMNQMFSAANRPFFGSTRLLFLDAIDKNEYTAFIRMHFKNGRKTISDDALNLIADYTLLHTFYTQNLCNAIFSMRSGNIGPQEVKNCFSELLKENEMYYFQFRQFLTSAQWNYLIAVAKEENIVRVTSQAFISKYQIGTPSNSRRLLKSLGEKELLLEIQTKDEIRYRVYDVFFMRWLQSTY